MHTLVLIGAMSLGAAGAAQTGEATSTSGATVEAMLTDFVEDYRSDGMARPIVFGIEVRDAAPAHWHVVVEEGDGEAMSVTLHEGFPETPIAFFTTDTETLTRIHDGELASLTAMGKAFSTDFAPLDLDTMEGFAPGPNTINDLVAAAFHFWTRGFPETVRFGDLAQTRSLHGGQATLFYYQEGFRSGFFIVQPGDHVNEDKASRTNPFPSMFVVTRGRMTARIGDVEREVGEGEMLFVAPGVSHEFWIEEGADHHAEGIILMFGEGA